MPCRRAVRSDASVAPAGCTAQGFARRAGAPCLSLCLLGESMAARSLYTRSEARVGRERRYVYSTPASLHPNTGERSPAPRAQMCAHARSIKLRARAHKHAAHVFAQVHDHSLYRFEHGVDLNAARIEHDLEFHGTWVRGTSTRFTCIRRLRVDCAVAREERVPLARPPARRGAQQQTLLLVGDGWRRRRSLGVEVPCLFLADGPSGRSVVTDARLTLSLEYRRGFFLFYTCRDGLMGFITNKTTTKNDRVNVIVECKK